MTNYIAWWEDPHTKECGRFIFSSALDRDEFIAMTSLIIYDTEEDNECYCDARSWGECACGNFEE